MQQRISVLLVALSLFVGSAWGQPAEDLIISEIMQNPDAVSDSEGEYIELYNPTSKTISLSGWTLTVDTESDELSDGSIPAGEFVVLCIEGTSNENGGLDRCAVDYPDRISLKNGGSTIVIEDDSGSEVDRVTYDGGTDWPDPNGASLEYVGPPDGDTNAAANWQMATTRRGQFEGGTGDLGSPGADSPTGRLPVELAGVSVTVERDRVSLFWQTLSEVKNAGFVVEHRGPEAAAWVRRGYVEGRGTTTRPNQYRFSTRVEGPGTHAFRLKQIDVDGTVSIAAVRNVHVTGPSFLTVSGPNPVRRGDRVTALVETDARPIEIRLYNVLGQCVRRLTHSRSSTSSVARIPVSTQPLSSGTYFLRARGGSQVDVRRISVVQ